MGLLYVNENGAQIGYEANKCVVNYKDGLKKLIPIESLEGITIMGQSQMTAKCTEECLKRGIPVVYFSKGGVYFGRVMSTSHINAGRQRMQRNIRLEEEQKMLSICRGKIENSRRIEEIIGYEGQAAKFYFRGLSKCIEREFQFNGRSRRPPKDEFNSMISLGYSILMNELYCKIEMKGLNPYFGFIHRDAEKHPTLASDMMEEWRAVIVDATVMSMINV